MKILQISPQIPLPLDNGGRISIYGILNSLSKRGHEMHFVAYRKHADQKYGFSELSKICKPYILDVQTENSPLGAVFNVFSKIPYNVSKFIRPELKNFLKDFFSENKVDLVHIDHLHMGWTIDLLRELTDAPVVLREHNLEYKIMQRYAEKAGNLMLRQYASYQSNKLKDYELELCEKFDLCVMISAEDEKLLNKLNPKAKTVTIPAGVDSSLFRLKRQNIIPYSIAHIGDITWLPNRDGLMWYLEEIFPKIVMRFPQVKLFLYGKGNETLALPGNLKNNIIVKGYVKDMWAEIIDKQLCVVPLRAGSGIRIKILELLAAGVNLISTSIGKEGIYVKDGESILVADSPGEFIDKTERFFNGQYDASAISLNGQKFIKENFTWESISENLEQKYLSLIKS